MGRVLLDTSAYSALRRGRNDILATIQEAEEIYVNAVVLGGLHTGFLGGARGAENRRILKRFLRAPLARHYAVIANDLRRAGTPVPTNDIWIAATAMEHGLELTTDSHYAHVRQITATLFPPH